MRKKIQKQMPLMITRIDHPHTEELEGISQILDANPIIYEWVLQDLTRGVGPSHHVDFQTVSSQKCSFWALRTPFSSPKMPS